MGQPERCGRDGAVRRVTPGAPTAQQRALRHDTDRRFLSAPAAADERDDVCLPQLMEAEQASIGAALKNREALRIVMEEARPGTFRWDKHCTILLALSRQWERSEPMIDKITTANELLTMGAYSELVGVVYLDHCCEMCPSAHHVRAYLRIVVQRARLRHLVLLGDAVQRQAMRPDADAAFLMSAIEGCVHDIDKYGCCDLTAAFARPSGQAIPSEISQPVNYQEVR